MGTAQMKKQSLPIEHDVEDNDALYQTRMPSSARRYNRAPQPIHSPQPKQITRSTRSMPAVPSAQPRSSTPSSQLKKQPAVHNTDDDYDVDVQEEPITQGTLVQRRRSSISPSNSNGVASDAVAPNTEALPHQRRFPLVPVLIGAVVTILLVMALTAFSSWWRVYQDDLHYGRPRTSQIDAVVGQGDSQTNPTHFIFLNLRRHVQIIEIPGGDASKTRIFVGPVLFGDGQDLTPVTGETRDVNGDGKPDLVVHIGDQQIVYLNDGTTFHLQ